MKKEQQYYEIKVTCTKCVCVRAECEEDAIQTAQDECTFGWDQSEAEIEDEYGDGTDPDHAKYIEQYKSAGEYYETEYFDD